MQLPPLQSPASSIHILSMQNLAIWGAMFFRVSGRKFGTKKAALNTFKIPSQHRIASRTRADVSWQTFPARSASDPKQPGKDLTCQLHWPTQATELTCGHVSLPLPNWNLHVQIHSSPRLQAVSVHCHCKNLTKERTLKNLRNNLPPLDWQSWVLWPAHKLTHHGNL